MIVALAALLTLAAQHRDPREAQPERPTVATHAYSVAPGFVEVESGVESDKYNDGSRAFQVLSNMKVGISSHVQLNVQMPFAGNTPSGTGPGDLTVGMKWRVLDAHRVLGSFAVLPALKLSTGPARLGRGTGTTDASVTLISSRTVRGVAVDLNAGYTRRSGDGSLAPRDALLWTASFGGTVVDKVGWVFEWFGYPATSGPAGQPASSALLFGPTFTPARKLVLDAGAIVALAGDQSYGLYAGLTWNLGRVAR